MRSTRFRVQNFRNVDDSGWIELERVTNFVGRNESGKTTLIKALHKFNPATPEPYKPQQEFPRDRYTREFKKPEDWPVCSVAFAIEGEIRDQVAVAVGADPPREAICVRFYDGSLAISYEPPLAVRTVDPAPIANALRSFASSTRRLPVPAEPEKADAAQTLRTELASWASAWVEKFADVSDLHNPEGVALLATLRKESEGRAAPETADIVEALQEAIDPALADARRPPFDKLVDEIINANLPVFIYFENYGILDSAVYLPRFLDDLRAKPDDPRVRTINAMFKHVGLTAQEIAELGQERVQQARAQNQNVTADMIAQDHERKEARAIKLNSASIDITKRFNKWYGQRRHSIDYQADGSYFRIWIADDRRPDVKIELESRSKGFQWFFSFYLVFLVESDEGHKNAVLLLDEPGLHLHPTAQQELIAFFENLAASNQLVYTTHSPFLIDGEHLHRVRPVTEDETGHSTITAETWPDDRETIFPMWAAAGYAMIRGLFVRQKNLLVEGMSDYLYLHALSNQCSKSGRPSLPDDIHPVPCGGTRLVGQMASMFLGEKVRPLVLLDGDEAGRARRNALIKELYAGRQSAIIMLDDVLGRAGAEVEIEDILGEAIILPVVNALIGQTLTLESADRSAGSLPSQIQAAAKRQAVKLPDGWKASVAMALVSQWAEKNEILPDAALDVAAKLFAVVNERFAERPKS
jgi:predicted ATPase